MRKALPYLFPVVFVCTAFVEDNLPKTKLVVAEFWMSECQMDCSVEKLRSRSFKDHSLTLKVDVMTNCSDRELVIWKYSGDTLGLSFQSKREMSVVMMDGKPDTNYVYKGSFCDCHFSVDMKIDSLDRDPKVIWIAGDLIIDTTYIARRYDKNGRLIEK